MPLQMGMRLGIPRYTGSTLDAAGGGNPLDNYGNAAFLFDVPLSTYRNGATQVGNFSSLSGLTFTRDSTGYAQTSGGVLVPFASGVPRITDKGLLIEGARTNLATYSSDWTDSSWSNSNVTVTAAAATAPDGTLTATKLSPTTSAGTTMVKNVGAVAATAASYSIYVKKGSGATDANKFIMRNLTTATILVNGTLNYDTGVWTTTTGNAALVSTLANGWYRITLYASSGITSGDSIQIYTGFTGSSETAGEYAYFWGAQLEAAAFASSYIPTTSSSATRLADAPVIDLLNPGLYDVSGQPELVTNGDFASNINGWAATSTNVSASWSAGKLRVACAANLASGHVANAAITTVVGRLYRFAFDFVTDAQTGNSFAFVGTSLGGNQNLAANIGSALGSYAFMFRATSTTTYLEFGTSTMSLLGDYFEIDNVSLKQVPDDQVIDYPCTIWVEFERVVDTGDNEYIFQADDGSSNNRSILRVDSSDTANYVSVAGGSVDGSQSVAGAIGLNSAQKFAARFGVLNDMRGARGGTLGAQDTSVAVPSTPSALRVGSSNVGSFQTFGYIRRAALWSNYAASDSQLQAMTSA